jgi:hypothetical protein
LRWRRGLRGGETGDEQERQGGAELHGEGFSSGEREGGRGGGSRPPPGLDGDIKAEYSGQNNRG